MKHTAGPWIVRYTARTDGIDTQRYDVVHYRNEYPHNETTDEFICSNVKGEANARLIAAAPELLDALTTLVRRADNGDTIEGGWYEVEKARAVIIKATS